MEIFSRQSLIIYDRTIGNNSLSDDDKVTQKLILIIYDEMDIFNVVRSQDNYLFPRVSEVFSYQLYDFKLQSSVSRFQFDDFVKDNFMSFTVL